MSHCCTSAHWILHLQSSLFKYRIKFETENLSDTRQNFLDGVSALYRSGRHKGTRREGDRNPWPHSCVSGKHDAPESARSRCAMCDAIQFVIKLEQNRTSTAAVLFKFSYLKAEQRRLKSGVHKSQTQGRVIFVGPQYGTIFWNTGNWGSIHFSVTLVPTYQTARCQDIED